MKPRVLMIAHGFPPTFSVGVLRTVRYAKYLREFGWEPIVLTSHDAKVQSLDESMLERVGDVEVHHTPSFELLNYGNSITGSSPRKMSKLASRLFRELPRDLWRYFAVPDDKRGWVSHAGGAEPSPRCVEYAETYLVQRFLRYHRSWRGLWHHGRAPQAHKTHK